MREMVWMTERLLNPSKTKGGGICWSCLQWTGKLPQMSIFLPPVSRWNSSAREERAAAAARTLWLSLMSGGSLLHKKERQPHTESNISVLHSYFGLLDFHWGGLSVTTLNPMSLRFWQWRDYFFLTTASFNSYDNNIGHNPEHYLQAWEKNINFTLRYLLFLIFFAPHSPFEYSKWFFWISKREFKTITLQSKKKKRRLGMQAAAWGLYLQEGWRRCPSRQSESL